jgi:preprotein translocase subunit YajC
VTPQLAGQLVALLPIVIVFVFFYFVAVLPRQQQDRKYREMLGRLKKGDRVVTRGGLYAVVLEVKDKDLMLELAQNVRVRAERSAVQSVLKRGGAGA